MQEKANIMEYYTISHIPDEELLTDEQIDQFYEKQLEKEKIPKQHLQMVNMKGQKIPVATTLSFNSKSSLIMTQEMLCYCQQLDDTSTLKTILWEYSDSILEEYSKSNRQIADRSCEEYRQIVDKYVEYYQEKLEIEEVNLRHRYFEPDSLGYVDSKKTVILNAYLRYMPEETIRYAICSQLCLLYVYQHIHTLSVEEEYLKLLRREYTQEQENQIMKHNIKMELD